MEILFIILSVVVIFIVWNIWSFLKYKKNEAKNKMTIQRYLSNGLTLDKALGKAFSDLNENLKLGLSSSTITIVAEKVADLNKMMGVDNVVEIYSTFIHRYIFRCTRKKSRSVSDTKIIYAIENMEIDERNGYFVIKPDTEKDFDKKYPNKY